MDPILNVRIDLHQFIPQCSVLVHHDGRVPSHGYKYGVNSTADGCHDDLADLKPDDKRECHDDRREISTLVIRWVGEFEVEVGEKSIQQPDKYSCPADDWSYQAIVDESVDAPVFHQGPGVFRRWKVGFPVQRDM